MKRAEIQETIDIMSRPNKYFICGTNDFSKRFYRKYRKELEITGFVEFADKNSAPYCLGEKVYSYDELDLSSEAMVLIIAKKRNKDIVEIDGRLKAMGLVKNKDYFYSKYFEMVYDAVFKDRAIFNFVEITITEVCTLKCKNCSQFMPHFNKPVHTPLEKVLEDIDALFRVMDYTFHFRLLGGETFLHPAIEEIIAYIVKNYRDKIDFFDIATNGTVIPRAEVLRICEEGAVTISISDYDIDERYSARVDSLVNELERFGVDYRRNKFEFWYEIGFPYVKETASEEKKIKLFEECQSDWRNFHDKRLYFCSVCASAQRAGMIEGASSDWFDFEGGVDKKELLQFNLGVNKQGYNSLCGLCKGYMPDANREHVKPGVQLLRNVVK